MPIKVCPHCGMRYVVGFDTTDFIHQCNSGNPVLDQEDVVVTGKWEDFSGSGTIGPQEVMRQGAENKLQGSDADIEFDEDVGNFTRRGERASTRRQRQKFTYINIKKDGLQ